MLEGMYDAKAQDGYTWVLNHLLDECNSCSTRVYRKIFPGFIKFLGSIKSFMAFIKS